MKRAQSLGIALIKDILTVHDGGKLQCWEVKQHLQEKVAIVKQQIQALETFQAESNGILSGWQKHPPSHLVEQTICPNIQQGVTCKV